MRVSAIVDIIDGTLINSTFVNSFESIRLDPKKINREDLFIAKENDNIEQAIKIIEGTAKQMGVEVEKK